MRSRTTIHLNPGAIALKVLLSAYACEPGKGSEPGMGWHWAVEIARLGHEVHILTRANNVQACERGLADLPGLRLSVHGYDLPRWARWWKAGQRGVRLYYVLWQWGASRRAQALNRAQAFDLVHHITFAVWRHPSFMGRLRIPFVFGPVGGGEDTPRGLRPSLPLRAKIVESLRAAANALASIDPLLLSTLRRASLILYKTADTLAHIPRRYHAQCICIQDVAADKEGLASAPAPGPASSPAPHFLFAGRLLYWKGVHLALRALAQVRAQLPDARLTIVGDGRDRAWLQSLAQDLGLESAVDWRGLLPHDEVLRIYAAHTAFVFPSLHDSGGTVIMESLAQGLPVLCLDLGGPGAILPADCGVKIPARGRTEEEVVADLSTAMVRLAADADFRATLAANALEAARRMTWSALVADAYTQIESRLALK
jgi:glycosyltransferase involved in cell wall biosynthesis